MLLTHALVLVTVLLVDVVHLALVDYIDPIYCEWLSVNLTLLVVIEDLHLTSAIVSREIILSFADLLFRRLVWI